jgi:hypothetical protein
MSQQSPSAPQGTETENRGTYDDRGAYENGGTYEGLPEATSSRTRQVQDPAVHQQAGTNGGMAGSGRSSGTLLQDPQALRQRWESVQVGFVDNPREAVGDAEQLVSSAIGEIVNLFRHQRENLETSWTEGGEPSTDDLRAAFQNYRDFFGRLLQV